MLEQEFSGEQIKANLRSLEKKLPGEEKPLYDFAKFLAERIQDKAQLTPKYFKSIYDLAVHDLEKGKDGNTRKPIESDLVGMPEFFYTSLRTYTGLITISVMPKTVTRRTL